MSSATIVIMLIVSPNILMKKRAPKKEIGSPMATQKAKRP